MSTRTRRLILIALVVLLAGLVASAPYRLRSFARGLTLSYAQPPDVRPLVATGDCLPEWYEFDAPDYDIYVTVNPIALNGAGIPVYDYRQRNGIAGWQYQPLVIAEYGIRALRAWCAEGDANGLVTAARQAEWLLANADRTAGFPVWRYDFPNPSFEAPVGWTSGMSSGAAMTLLTQIHAVTGEARYREAALHALTAFTVLVAEGGLREPDGDGAWFEEVAHPDAPRAHILNGHLLAVKALAYAADHLHNDTAARLAGEGIEVVRTHLHEFNGDGRTRYDLLHPDNWRRPDEYAHRIHALLVTWAGERIGNADMIAMGQRWASWLP